MNEVLSVTQDLQLNPLQVETDLPDIKPTFSQQACSDLLQRIRTQIPVDDARILELRAGNALYSTIAREYGITAFQARRHINHLLSLISQKHSAELLSFAWLLDQLLDANHGEYQLNHLSNQLGLRKAEAQLMILLTKDFFQMPVLHYRNRVFRIIHLNR